MKLVKGSFYVILTLLYIWVSSVIIVFHGPFGYLKDYVTGTIGSSGHNYLLEPLTFGTVSLKSYQQSIAIDTSKIQKDTNISKSVSNRFESITDPTIKVEDYKAKTFSAKIMLISDPKRIQVAVSKYKGDLGQTVSEMVADHQAVAGINGGGFLDPQYRGTGGTPLGTTMHNGQFITHGGTTDIAGFTRQGVLVVGNYSEQELTNLGVTEAISFGPVLVNDGKGVLNGDGGWGAAPRTAIGQREDGTVIMIVTDGRLIHGPSNLGATIRDMMNLMLKYGAINATNLDGGSSTTMVKDGLLVNEPTDVLGERKIASSFIVMPE